MDNRDLLKDLPKDRLPPEEEQILVKRGTPAALEKLVMHAMREAFFYARRCCRGRLEDGEIFSLCYLSLARAATNFHAGPTRFFAYAKIYVRGEICKEWRTKDVVRHAGNIASTDRLNDEVEKVVRFRECNEAEDISNPRVLGEDGTIEPEFDAIVNRETWKIVEPLIASRLNAREQKILMLKYKEGLNFREIGDKLGVSRSAIQARHAGALKKLRGALESKRGLL